MRGEAVADRVERASAAGRDSGDPWRGITRLTPRMNNDTTTLAAAAMCQRRSGTRCPGLGVAIQPATSCCARNAAPQPALHIDFGGKLGRCHEPGLEGGALRSREVTRDIT